MAFDLQEQEQIDEMKAFWQQWGKLISGAVLAASLGYLGFKGYHWYQQNQAEKASAEFAALAPAIEAKDVAKLKAGVLGLEQDYAGSAYATRGALILAKAAFDLNDVKLAQSQLEWTLQNAGDESVAAVARLRLATLQLDQKQYDAAVSELSKEHPTSFDALYLDLKGDVFVAKGDNGAARDAYKSALAKLPADAPARQLTQTKLDALGG